MRTVIPNPIRKSAWGLVKAGGLVTGGLAGGMSAPFGLMALGVPEPVSLIVGGIIVALGAAMAIPVLGQTALYPLIIGAGPRFEEKRLGPLSRV